MGRDDKITPLDFVPFRLVGQQGLGALLEARPEGKGSCCTAAL